MRAADAPLPGRRPAPGEGSSGTRRDAVSPLTLNRLSVYLRSLQELLARGETSVSSQRLATEFHLSASQIRKDLAQFGEFGVRGVGYDVETLSSKLSALLGLDRVRAMVLVGVGNLGTAFARYPAFNRGSFLVVAGFDADPAKQGRRIGRIPIHALEELTVVAREKGAEIAILAVPGDSAADALERVREAGIGAVLNFAPVSLPSTPDCRVKNVDLRIHLEELSFFLESEDEPSPDGQSPLLPAS